MHRASKAASDQGVQVSMWTELPRDVIEIVTKDMSGRPMDLPEH